MSEVGRCKARSVVAWNARHLYVSDLVMFICKCQEAVSMSCTIKGLNPVE
jgi:hypothetical protein